jgi:PIN domain nuclease of toxin-antitoxin system
MKALLDTQVWLWMLGAPDRLGDQARRLVEDPATTLLLSAASSWEIAIKWGLGKLELPDPPEDYVPDRIRSSGVTPLPIEHSHALGVASLEAHHRDPFDRLLVAQAIAEDIPILTADPVFDRYPIQPIPAGG